MNKSRDVGISVPISKNDAPHFTKNRDIIAEREKYQKNNNIERDENGYPIDGGRGNRSTKDGRITKAERAAYKTIQREQREEL